MDKELTLNDINEFGKAFDQDRANTISMNAVTSNGINAAAKSPVAKSRNQFGFSVEVEAGKVCDQKQSGRCWMFASYNVMRLEIMNKLNIENMELSQTYSLFYDKLEKANHFLENMLEVIDEPLVNSKENFYTKIR